MNIIAHRDFGYILLQHFGGAFEKIEHNFGDVK